MACDSGQGVSLWLNMTSFETWLEMEWRGVGEAALTPKRPGS